MATMTAICFHILGIACSSRSDVRIRSFILETMPSGSRRALEYALVHHPPDGVEQQLCGEDRRRARVVVVRSDFDQVDTNHLALQRQSGKDLQSLVIRQSAMARRARSWRDGRVEAVDIDGQVIPHALRDAIE